jgi:hypothetical protein
VPFTSVIPISSKPTAKPVDRKVVIHRRKSASLSSTTLLRQPDPERQILRVSTEFKLDVVKPSARLRPQPVPSQKARPPSRRSAPSVWVSGDRDALHSVPRYALHVNVPGVQREQGGQRPVEPPFGLPPALVVKGRS